jgi:hypothetical protein
LNPKKILENFPPLKDVRGASPETQNPQSPRRRDRSSESTDGNFFIDLILYWQVLSVGYSVIDGTQSRCRGYVYDGRSYLMGGLVSVPD